MKPYKLLTLLATGAAVTWTMPAHGQGYRVRIDTRFQSVAYRGVQLDSVLASDVLPGDTTAGGIATYCPSGAVYCSYYTAGPEMRGSPVVASVDGVLWGFGVKGLRLVAQARVGGDLANPDVWPGTKPTAYLIEGYAEYANRWLTAELGRTHVATRLGYWGFDGAKADVRLLGNRLSVEGYGGWGLERGVAVPVTSSALNPLDDLQPRERQTIWGGALGWTQTGIDARLTYQRQLDGQSNNIGSEFVALDATIKPVRGFTLSGGADYNMAEGLWGTADLAATLSSARGQFSATVGGRRYRPYFPLWTIWGAFSPVAYNAGYASVAYAPVQGVELWGRGETYKYQETEAESPSVRVEDDGWRATLGGAFKRLSGWTFQADYFIDKGPGARSQGFDVVAAWRPIRSLYVVGDVRQLQRPLEFRFNDSEVWSYGLRLDYEAVGNLRLNGGIRYYDEDRGRPDASAFSWNQFRINLGATLHFGSPTAGAIHPAILSIPEVRGTR
jgi:hypothetical protein